MLLILSSQHYHPATLAIFNLDVACSNVAAVQLAC